MIHDKAVIISHIGGTRNQDIDIIKGILIILVVLGHKIQNGSGAVVINSGCFWDDPLYKIIYMFHMPCFGLISGYLFFHSVQRKSTWEVIIGRMNACVIPICSVTLCIVLANTFFRGTNYSIKSLIFAPVNVLWYLQALFISSIVCLIAHALFKDSIIPHLIILLLCFMSPDIFWHIYGNTCISILQSVIIALCEFETSSVFLNPRGFSLHRQLCLSFAFCSGVKRHIFIYPNLLCWDNLRLRLS